MTKIKASILFLFLIGLGTGILAQTKITREQYIDRYKDIAIENMRNHKVPASITLAQGVLESGDGNSELARKSNNHFGIKCHSDWTGKRTYHDDDKKKECFRVYKTVYDSYADHADFLHKSRYAKCFELDIIDYKGWAKELKKAGYATNPKYPALLIKIIEDYELYKYDEIAIKGAKKSKSTDKKAPTKGYDKNSEFGDIDYYDNKPMVQMSENKIKYIKATKGDTPESLAKKMNFGSWQIKSYNDVGKGYKFDEGEIVYLQPKRNKCSKKFHLVKSGDSVWSISQFYGVKMSKIYKYNNLSKGDKVKPGQKVFLRKP